MYFVYDVETNKQVAGPFPDGGAAAAHARDIRAMNGRAYRVGQTDATTFRRVVWNCEWEPFPVQEGESCLAFPDYSDAPTTPYARHASVYSTDRACRFAGSTMTATLLIFATPDGDDWRMREHTKFRPLPWQGEDWWQDSDVPWTHIPYPSTVRPGNVAYTATHGDGMADRQVSIPVGRFLSRFFPDISDADKQSYALKMADMYAPITDLKFARTPEEIADVYKNGPNSCMSGGFHDVMPAGIDNPTYVYGAGDLAVVYFLNTSGRPAARVLCWPERKIYGRPYGDIDRMRPALERLGYSSDPDGFEGARLLKVRVGRGYVMPYVDGGYYAEDCGDHFKLSSDDGYFCDSTEGITYDGEAGECYNCGERVRGGPCEGPGEQTLCQHCYEEETGSCEDCDERFYTGDLTFTEWDAYLCQDCFDEYPTCYHCGATVLETEEIAGEEYCDGCATNPDVIGDCECGERYNIAAPCECDALSGEDM
jgi:hypothetical protein